MDTANLENIDWETIVQKITDLATCETARENLQQLSPLATREQCEESFEKIAAIKSLLLHSGVRPFFESLDLFQVWFHRLSKDATLQTLELKDVRHFLVEIEVLSATLEESEHSFIKTIHNNLIDPSEPLSAIDQIMTADGSIRTDASEELYKLFNEKNQKARDVSKILDMLVKENDLQHVLQDKYVTTREGRWVLPVKSGMQGQFEGIIHASSQSKQTVFMEPKEVVKVNNRLREVETEINNEINRLLKALSQYLLQRKDELAEAYENALSMDLLYAKAQIANNTQANTPTFSNDHLELNNLRHPLLVLDENTEVTPNSVVLDSENRVLLLSGPNAGGKTVLLKSVGLAAHMARCGLLICADDESKLPFFQGIHVGVGDSQSVDSHLSTFAAHLKILDFAAKAEGMDQLLLIDEICGSTDPEEGTALARSFIHRFSQNKVFGVVTSHLGPLKSGWESDSGVVNGCLEYNNETGQPTYHFLMGIPGQSLAIQTAKRVGVSQDIVEKAMDFLSPETKRQLESLEKLEEHKEELQKIKSDLLEKRKEALKEKSKYHALVQKYEKEKSQMLNTVVKRAEKKIDRMVDLSNVDKIFKKHATPNDIKKQLPNVIKPSDSASASTRAHENVEEFEASFPPGSKVFATTIGKDGIVQGPANSKGEIPILSNSMRLLVHWSDLKSPIRPSNPTQKILRQKSASGVSSHILSVPDQQLDLRGLNVNQAIENLEVKLDSAATQSVDRVKIIHGHGTETLKKAIRGYLSRSLYVKKWTSGSKESGGDGVTWVEIKD